MVTDREIASFDQPTAMLVAQLDRDANLWDREWVIGQLKKRPDDAAAAAAVAHAATTADYFLTRQTAVAVAVNVTLSPRPMLAGEWVMLTPRSAVFGGTAIRANRTSG